MSLLLPPLAFEPSDANDHCETPAEAFAHIKPLLDALSTALDLPPADLVPLDPCVCVRQCAQP